MGNNIIFNKDEKSATIYIMKVYNVDVSEVWNHFTKEDLLDLWWAPNPWKCETLKMDFQPNGIWRYIMKGGENEKHYAAAQFHEITVNRSFDWTDFFTDKAGTQLKEFPEANWLFGFTGVQEGTKLTVNIHFKSTEDMNAHLEMGFEEGFKMGLNQLEDLFNKKD